VEINAKPQAIKEGEAHNLHIFVWKGEIQTIITKKETVLSILVHAP